MAKNVSQEEALKEFLLLSKSNIVVATEQKTTAKEVTSKVGNDTFLGQANPEAYEKDRQTEIRRMLAEWGDKKKDMAKGFGYGIVIKEILESFQFVDRLKLLQIKRTIHDNECPGSRYTVDPGASTDPFDHDYYLPKNFVDLRGEELILTSTVETYDCSPSERCGTCSGSGACIGCNGKGEGRCEHCGGRGACPKCQGKGEVRCSCGNGLVKNASGVMVKCNSCAGSGFVKCNDRWFNKDILSKGGKSCSGSGSCAECGGSGQITCKNCSGSGKCRNCNGSGEIICKRCEGTGNYQTFQAATTQYLTFNSAIGHLHEKLKLDFFNDIDAEPIFDIAVLEYTNQTTYAQRMVELKAKLAGHTEIYNDLKIENLLTGFPSESESTKNGRLQMAVFQFPTFEVQYTYHDVEYSLLIVQGANGKFYIKAETVPTLSGRERWRRFCSDWAFILNPFQGKNSSYNKVKFLTQVAILQMISDGKKEPSEIAVLTSFINATPLSKSKKTKLLDLLAKEHEKKVLTMTVSKSRITRQTREDGLIFAYTFSLATGNSSVAESKTLAQYQEMLGLQGFVAKPKIDAARLCSKARTNMLLFTEGVFDEYVRQRSKKEWSKKNIVRIVYWVVGVVVFTSIVSPAGTGKRPQVMGESAVDGSAITKNQSVAMQAENMAKADTSLLNTPSDTADTLLDSNPQTDSTAVQIAEPTEGCASVDIGPFVYGAEKGDLTTIQDLIRKCTQITNTPGPDRGRTALHEAADHNKLDVLKYLLENGANVNIQDADGRTALIDAIDRQFFDAAIQLLSAGANPDLREKDGATALIFASKRKNPELVKALLEKNADRSITDNVGKKAIDYAGLKREVKQLLTD